MLGLERDAVRVVGHDPRWSNAFKDEKTRLLQQLGHLVIDIQHVGSTAVPGLDSKPILDIAIAVESMRLIAELRPALCSLGYIDRGNTGDTGGYLFVKEVSPKVRSHHLHVVTIHDERWRNYLQFRDVLRSNCRLRTEYADLKCSLGLKYARDRERYTWGKHKFIHRVLKEAKV